MTRVFVDAAVLAKLKSDGGCVEVCSPSGETVGYFCSVAGADKSLYDRADIPFSDAELDRRAKEPGGRPLAEILADLQKKA